MLTVRDVREIYVKLGVIDQKLNALTAISTRLDSIDEKLADHETRLTKIEAFQGFIVWMTNGGWAVVVGAAYVLTKIGII